MSDYKLKLTQLKEGKVYQREQGGFVQLKNGDFEFAKDDKLKFKKDDGEIKVTDTFTSTTLRQVLTLRETLNEYTAEDQPRLKEYKRIKLLTKIVDEIEALKK